MAPQDGGVTVEFRGWSHFKLTSPTGKVILTNPFITNNADAAVTLDEAIAESVDIILVADGHPDELGDSVPIMRGTNAALVIPFEAGDWLTRRDSLPAARVLRTNPGNTHRIEGITKVGNRSRRFVRVRVGRSVVGEVPVVVEEENLGRA